jgi:hypothetical protein
MDYIDGVHIFYILKNVAYFFSRVCVSLRNIRSLRPSGGVSDALKCAAILIFIYYVILKV